MDSLSPLAQLPPQEAQEVTGALIDTFPALEPLLAEIRAKSGAASASPLTALIAAADQLNTLGAFEENAKTITDLAQALLKLENAVTNLEKSLSPR
jgi:hypothetical protein